jgi:glycosyltransferase involved in cell wall biosynthesis
VTPTISVVVATCGNRDEWDALADRAAASVHAQTNRCRSLHRVHGATLAGARNAGAVDAPGTHLVFLDADDELDPGFLEAMAAAGDIDIGRPSTIGVYGDGHTDDTPVMLPRTDLRRRNCIVVSAMVRRALFLEAGGFVDLPALEDWHLWRRLQARGAEFVDVPDAVLRVHVRDGSRNQDTAAHAAAYRRVLRET